MTCVFANKGHDLRNLYLGEYKNYTIQQIAVRADL